MGTGGDPSAVPVAHAECVPCKNGAEERPEASRTALAIFFGKANAVHGNRNLDYLAVQQVVGGVYRFRVAHSL
jgi:hypothetical protein